MESEQRPDLLENSQNAEDPTAASIGSVIILTWTREPVRTPPSSLSFESHQKGLDRVPGKSVCPVIFPRGNPSLRLATRFCVPCHLGLGIDRPSPPKLPSPGICLWLKAQLFLVAYNIGHKQSICMAHGVV